MLVLLMIATSSSFGQVIKRDSLYCRTIEQEKDVIKKEIDKLKKDVVLHTIIADSSIAKANRISKKTILNQIEYEKISTNVSAYDDSDIINFWASHKKR